MIKSLKNLFDSLLQPAAGGQRTVSAEEALHLAVAVLLVEVMRADAQRPEAERRAVVDALRTGFLLDEADVERLVEEAERTARDATDYHAFTSRLNDQLDMPQKIELIEQMWRVAFADGHLAADEQHVLWRLADLLHVPHGAYVNAKMRAQGTGGTA